MADICKMYIRINKKPSVLRKEKAESRHIVYGDYISSQLGESEDKDS